MNLTLDHDHPHPTTDELVRRFREGEAGPAGINSAKTLATRARKLESALRGLLYVIEIDGLVPESVSYMQRARAALQLSPVRARTTKGAARD